MPKKLKFLSLLLFLFLPFLSVAAKNSVTLSPEAEVSVFTCTAGSELYTAFGHSAIRVKDDANSLDVTFNFGTFDFSAPHFYYKFLRGETYYMLALQSTLSFNAVYEYENRHVYQQVLDLTAQQKQDLTDLLFENYEPQNRFYLYNFVFDNCATRVYESLNKVVDLNPEVSLEPEWTFRESIEYYTGKNSWGGFGIDFIFGKDADRTMTTQQRLFLPEQLMLYLEQQQINSNKPLVKESNIGTFGSPAYPYLVSPQFCSIILIFIIAFFTLFDKKRNKFSWWFDAVLSLVFFILGTIAFSLTFFSIHPLVTNNFNLLLYNPLWLVFSILICIPKGRNLIYKYRNVLVLLILLLVAVRIFCGQQWHALISIMVVYALRLNFLPDNMKTQAKVNHPDKKFKRQKSLLFLLALPSLLFSQESKLTVVVLVDGLSTDAMNKMRPYWQQGGLRTIDEEAHASTISFEQLVFGGDETVATMMTGANPSQHGLAANTYYSRADREVFSMFEDKAEKGINTIEKLSARNILTPTIADEFRLSHTPRSKIYSVGIHPSTVITLAGHSANACMWIEPKQMRWATTTYYSEGLPNVADEFNVKNRFDALTEQPWTPRMDINMYMCPTDEEKRKPFSYNMKQNLLASPAANTAVVELALALQKSEKLGTQQPDLLFIELTVESPKAKSDLIATAEQEDMYIRLNQDLGYLLEQLQKRVGKHNVRVIMFGKPNLGIGEKQIERVKMKYQLFNTERAAALVNTYLMAIYGHERWIDGGYGQSIYLNRTLIEQKKMSVARLQEQVSDFLIEFSGVAVAFPSSVIPLLPHDDTQNSQLRLTFNKRCFGDVVFLLEPCWVTTDSKERLFDSVVQQNVETPFYILTSQPISAPERNIKATEVKNIILK